MAAARISATPYTRLKKQGTYQILLAKQLPKHNSQQLLLSENSLQRGYASESTGVAMDQEPTPPRSLSELPAWC
jgi:hypothetical protein